MSSSRINFFTKIARIFRKQADGRAKETVKLIGEDHLGNKYYEKNKPSHFRPVHRYFDKSQGVSSFEEIVNATHVPPAWDAWLRFRRQDPPTKEEVQESEEYYKMQQEMAQRKKMEADIQNMKGNIEKPARDAKMPKPRVIPPDQYPSS